MQTVSGTLIKVQNGKPGQATTMHNVDKTNGPLGRSYLYQSTSKPACRYLVFSRQVLCLEQVLAVVCGRSGRRALGDPLQLRVSVKLVLSPLEGVLQALATVSHWLLEGRQPTETRERQLVLSPLEGVLPALATVFHWLLEGRQPTETRGRQLVLSPLDSVLRRWRRSLIGSLRAVNLQRQEDVNWYCLQLRESSSRWQWSLIGSFRAVNLQRQEDVNWYCLHLRESSSRWRRSLHWLLEGRQPTETRGRQLVLSPLEGVLPALATVSHIGSLRAVNQQRQEDVNWYSLADTINCRKRRVADANLLSKSATARRIPAESKCPARVIF